jgi:2-(1,2-epoxy-1,2-dihydrophenyl)acetyl-CoA isomerase
MTPSPSDLVVVTRTGGVTTLSLNRPAALNALDVPMAKAFLAACQSLANDPELRAVVLCGEGRAFGAGGDVAALQADPTATAHELISCLHKAVLLLTGLDAPVVASLHGVVAGGALSLAMACDLAIAGEGTRFNLAYANLGTSCDLSGSWHLPRLVGLRNAMQIALLSDTFDAAEALRVGLVNRLVPDAQLQDETQALALRIAAGPTRAYGHLKRLLRQSFDHDLPTQLEAERDAFEACTRTADFTEGVDAFRARRRPVFVGR